MFTESAEIYDLIYAGFKDYAEESARLAALLRHVYPECRSVLDLACGTGEHMRHLAANGFRVDGIDLDERFVQIAENAAIRVPAMADLPPALAAAPATAEPGLQPAFAS